MPTRVQIGPNEALDVTVISTTQIIATYAGGGDGPEDVIVSTSVGTATLPGGFDALRPPVITAVVPSRGPGGTRVTIHGHGFEA
jgi:hypothetical protein